MIVLVRDFTHLRLSELASNWSPSVAVDAVHESGELVLQVFAAIE